MVLSIAAHSSAVRLLHDLDNDLRGSTGTSGIVFDLPLSGLNNLTAALVEFKANENKKEMEGNLRWNRRVKTL